MAVCPCDAFPSSQSGGKRLVGKNKSGNFVSCFRKLSTLWKKTSNPSFCNATSSPPRCACSFFALYVRCIVRCPCSTLKPVLARWTGLRYSGRSPFFMSIIWSIRWKTGRGKRSMLFVKMIAVAGSAIMICRNCIRIFIASVVAVRTVFVHCRCRTSICPKAFVFIRLISYLRGFAPNVPPARMPDVLAKKRERGNTKRRSGCGTIVLHPDRLYQRFFYSPASARRHALRRNRLFCLAFVRTPMMRKGLLKVVKH